jgi:hypothetical protein
VYAATGRGFPTNSMGAWSVLREPGKHFEMDSGGRSKCDGGGKLLGAWTGRLLSQVGGSWGGAMVVDWELVNGLLEWVVGGVGETAAGYA